MLIGSVGFYSTFIDSHNWTVQNGKKQVKQPNNVHLRFESQFGNAFWCSVYNANLCVSIDLLTMTKKSEHWISPSPTIPLQFLLTKWESLNDVSWYLSILWLNWHIYSLSTTYGHTIAMSAKLSAADRRDMNLHTYKDRHSAFMKMVERQKELEEEQQRRRGDSFYNSYNQPIRAMSSPTPNRRFGKVRWERDWSSGHCYMHD